MKKQIIENNKRNGYVNNVIMLDDMYEMTAHIEPCGIKEYSVSVIIYDGYKTVYQECYTDCTSIAQAKKELTQLKNEAIEELKTYILKQLIKQYQIQNELLKA